MDFRHPYLSRQLVAYIGSKRSLLPFIHENLERIGGEAAHRARPLVFSDPFAGSGAVSRLGRAMGWEVLANDWEPYSLVVNSCHLAVPASRLPSLFRRQGGIEGALAELNALREPQHGRRYISRHYAPRATSTADWRTERLFYTAENALAIDAIRDRIEDWYPGGLLAGEPGSDSGAEKSLLLGPLLYEAATHTNTSGVFKACHRGFGGHGADALRRITAAIELEPPVLLEAARPARVFCQDARRFLAGRTVDVCYLDPPYTVHQYGSNYFMLNTIARWDRPPVCEERGVDGRLLRKAGIRQDWTATRSAFCYRHSAREAMREVVEAADCRWLCVSYGSDGLLDLEELCDMLAATGRLEIRVRDHVKYPGGKGSLRRSSRCMELLAIVDRASRSSPARRRAAQAVLAERRLAELLSSGFHPRRIEERFAVSGEDVVLCRQPLLVLPMRHRYRVFEESAGTRRVLQALPGLPRVVEGLRACLLADRGEEVEVLQELARGCADRGEQRRLLSRALRLLAGFAHRKYRAPFRCALAGLRGLAAGVPAASWMEERLDRIESVAARRGVVV